MVSAIWGKRKSTFIKNQEISNDQLKMNKTIDTFLLNGNKFMQELRLKKTGFT